MGALTRDRRTSFKAQGTHRHRRRAIGAVKVFKGGIAAENSAGHLVPATDAEALIIVGVFEETVDNSAGVAGALEANYVTGVEAEFVNSGGSIGQADLHAFVKDDQSVGDEAASTYKNYVGKVIEFTATTVLVYIDEDANGGRALGGDVATIVNAAVSPALTEAGIPVLIPIDIPDAATATYVYKTTDKIEIIDAWNIKDAAGAGNTIQVTDGADAAITNAMAAAVDKTVTHAGTIDKAKRVLAAGATFKVVATRAAGSMAAQLFILAIKRN